VPRLLTLVEGCLILAGFALMAIYLDRGRLGMFLWFLFVMGALLAWLWVIYGPRGKRG
jgi:hypothetical protein